MIKRLKYRVLLYSFITLSLPLYGQINLNQVGDWINQKRQDQGLRPLAIETKLSESSSSYALDLAGRGLLSHRDKENRGPLERYSLVGGSALAVGEILGTKSPEAPLEELLDAWWNSPTHREQILNPRWFCIGLAVERGQEGDIVVVHFSSSLLLEYSFIQTEEGRFLEFTPYPHAEVILFTHVLSKEKLYWDWLKEKKIPLPEDSPLFLEVSSGGKWGLSNRFVKLSYERN